MDSPSIWCCDSIDFTSFICRSLLIDKRISKGRANCVSCGKFVDGNTSVNNGEEPRFVCSVQCGIDYITKTST